LIEEKSYKGGSLPLLNQKKEEVADPKKEKGWAPHTNYTTTKMTT
jgi:hypothetical protein